MCLNLWELWAFENVLERDPENDENVVWISQLIRSKSSSANSISRCKYWFAWVMTRIKQIVVQITKVVNFASRFSKPQARSLETFWIIEHANVKFKTSFSSFSIQNAWSSIEHKSDLCSCSKGTVPRVLITCYEFFHSPNKYDYHYIAKFVDNTCCISNMLIN